MAISEKLADYEETKELLGRLRVRELEKLAKQSNIALETGDWEDKVVPAKTKQEIIDILVESEFRESDLVRTLGPTRLAKDELLNYMTVRELRGLAKQHDIALRKTSFLGTKRAARKEDIVYILESELSPSKIRQYIKKISLIQKKAKKEAATKQKAKRQSKTRKKARPIGLSDIKKHDRFVKVLITPHAMRVLLALDTLQKPSTLYDIKDQIHRVRDWLSSGQLRYVMRKLEDLRIVRREYETKGRRPIPRFQTTQDGKKLVKAFKKLLMELRR